MCGSWRRARVVGALAVAVGGGCRQSGPPAEGTLPAIPAPADGGTSSTAADAGAAGAGSGGGDHDAAVADAGSRPMCPAGPSEPPDAGDAPGSTVAAGGLWSAPTLPPFSCAPLASPFYFAPPAPGTAGAYARCASFDDPRTVQLAVSHDGARVAMVGGDGIVRVVEVASRTVVGVLAPARAVVNQATFSPSGDTILTVARGERVATLWRADSFQPIWTTFLPGHTYFHGDQGAGAAAFSPDGRSALVSPGSDLFLLDAPTGAIRASRSPGSYSVVMDASYGWGGRRVAVAESPLEGHCNHRPAGGTVTIVDPDTLSSITTVMTWGGYGTADGLGHAQMLAASAADLLLTPGSSAEPFTHAFKLSDGTALPSPLPSAQSFFPVALAADGTTVLVIDFDGTMRTARVDGSTLASTAGPASVEDSLRAGGATAVAMTADGATVALGGEGPDLLDVWRPADGAAAPSAVCTSEHRGGEPSMMTSLSGDGQLLAVDWGTEIRVVRRADGTRISTISHNGDEVFSMMSLSPDGRHLVAEFAGPTPPPPNYSIPFPLAAFRTSDGALTVDLGDEFKNGFSGGFVFAPEGTHLYGTRFQPGGVNGQLDVFDAEAGGPPVARPIGNYVGLTGISDGCPLLTAQGRGAWRSCDACDGPLFALGAESGKLSQDGRWFISEDGQDAGAGVTLWKVSSEPAPVAIFPRRPEEATWHPRELPVAVTNGGRLVITGASTGASCYSGPNFELHVHDTQTGAVVDTLPPGLTSTDAEGRVLAYGPQIWCAR